jgi:hypothetical protein
VHQKHSTYAETVKPVNAAGNIAFEQILCPTKLHDTDDNTFPAISLTFDTVAVMVAPRRLLGYNKLIDEK